MPLRLSNKDFYNNILCDFSPMHCIKIVCTVPSDAFHIRNHLHVTLSYIIHFDSSSFSSLYTGPAIIYRVASP